MNAERFPKVVDSIKTVIALYKKGETDLEKFRDAANAAYARSKEYEKFAKHLLKLLREAK